VMYLSLKRRLQVEYGPGIFIVAQVIAVAPVFQIWSHTVLLAARGVLIIMWQLYLKLTFNLPSLFFASPPGSPKFTIGTLIAASFHAHNFAMISLKLALAGKD